ncbi:MAG: hypothetical protein HUJ91_06330 [Bacteroidales bacterium]|nr:hypothetical protein [Bacteroidales bacterium]
MERKTLSVESFVKRNYAKPAVEQFEILCENICTGSDLEDYEEEDWLTGGGE